MAEIHADWDRIKVLAHLETLREDHEREVAIADAFEEAADQHRRDADRTQVQIKHCERLFAKPRTEAANDTRNLRTINATKATR